MQPLSHVRHIETGWARCCRATLTLAVAGICTNDADAYPGDRPDELAGQARRAGWAFPYAPVQRRMILGGVISEYHRAA